MEESEIVALPTILPQTGTPISERVRTLSHPKVDVALAPMKGSSDPSLASWLEKLPESDQEADEYVVLPSNGMITPIVHVPEESSDYAKLINGREVNVNKYLQS